MIRRTLSQNEKAKKLIIFCIGTLNVKVKPLFIFWFSRQKITYDANSHKVDLKLLKDMKK